MSDTDPDRDLRELFARLRQEDRPRAAPLRIPSPAEAPATTLRPGHPLHAAAAIAAVIAITILGAVTYWRHETLRVGEQNDAHHRALASGHWSAPTDFLLDTPGSRLLSTVPTFGSFEHWIAVDARRSTPKSNVTTSRMRNPS